MSPFDRLPTETGHNAEVKPHQVIQVDDSSDQQSSGNISNAESDLPGESRFYRSPRRDVQREPGRKLPDRSRASHDTNLQSFSLAEETAIVKKLDRRLVLLLASLYLLSFLDRSSKFFLFTKSIELESRD
jgi:hypothetical protein